jgi:predicted MFS family arabinose efflux permease
LDQEFPLYRAALCGLLAMLVGIGIARFGYSPLVPALVAARWFSPSAAFWLGAVNLLGYLLGAWSMRSWTARIHARPAVVGLMALTCLCLGASAWDLGAVYFGFWRLLSGLTGGALMVLMAAAVTGRAPAAKRGQVGGITFAGMGLGIMLSGLVIPRLLVFGLPATWLILGLLSLFATAVVGFAMPDAVIQPAPAAKGERTLTRPILLLLLAYGLCALGFVPHMLFLASFVAIGLHRGVAAGAATSAVLGFAAAVGPPVLGRLADRFGFLPTLAIGYVVMAASVALPLVTNDGLVLSLSAFGVGAIGLGTVMLTSGALSGLVPANRMAATWGLATVVYGICQAVCAAGFSQLFHVTGSFLLLFAIGAMAAATAGVSVFAAGRTQAHAALT